VLVRKPLAQRREGIRILGGLLRLRKSLAGVEAFLLIGARKAVD